MTTPLTLSIVTFVLLAVIDVIRRWQPKKLFWLHTIAESGFTWSALILAAGLPFVEFSGWRIMSVLLVPVAIYAFTWLSWGAYLCVCDMFSWETEHPRLTSGMLIVFLVALTVEYGWLNWPAAPFLHASRQIRLFDKSAHLHPDVRFAGRRKLAIDDARKEIEISLVKMNRSLDQVTRPLKRQDHDLVALQESVTQLTSLSDNIIQEYEHLVKLKSNFQAQVDDAPQHFLNAAEVFRSYAREERALHFHELADTYEDTADLWTALSQTVAEQRISLGEMENVIHFIRRGRLMLMRISDPSVPSVDELARYSQLQENIGLFVQRFDELRATIRGLTDELEQELDKTVDPLSPPSVEA